MLKETTVHCPYCGEPFDAFVDDSAGDQSYVEDCYVCCRPIEFGISVDLTGDLHVTVRRDDD